MKTIDILITAWPNHPRRFECLVGTLDALEKNLVADGFEVALKIYTESARDPKHPWMGGELEKLSADSGIELHWSEGPPSLPAQLNRLHRESRADLRFYLQDDWELRRPLNLASAAEALLADPLAAGVRFWAKTNYLPAVSDSPWLVVDLAAPWSYGDNPALWHRRFFDTYGPFSVEGDFGAHEHVMAATVRGGPLKILAAPELAEAADYYFRHTGSISSLPNESRWLDRDRNPPMKIAALCCTYLRPRLLERILECWRRQDYPLDCRSLVILDDAGIHEPQEGEGWRIVSTPSRYATLGEKRNACAALAPAEAEAFCIWDDDDMYLPWAISTCARTLKKSPWSRPSQVLHHRGDPQRLQRHATGGLYHGGWAYTRAAFERVGGYRAINSGEDQDLARRFEAAGIAQADPCADGTAPFYVFVDSQASYHISWCGQGRKAWDEIGQRERPAERVRVRPFSDFDVWRLPISSDIQPRPF